MKDRKPRRKSAETKGSVDDLMRSVFDSLSVKVLAEAVANAPPTDDELDAIEANIDGLQLPIPAPAVDKKRARR